LHQDDIYIYAYHGINYPKLRDVLPQGCLWAAFLFGDMAKSKKATFIVGTKDVADFFDVTDEAVRLWAKNGCPKDSRGRWNLKEVFVWWWDNIASDRLERGDDDETLKSAKRRYWVAKAQNEEIKADVTRGKLVPVDDVAREWAARVTELTGGLNAMAYRLAPALEGKTKMEILDIIKAEVRELRESYARVGTYCPEVDAEGD